MPKSRPISLPVIFEKMQPLVDRSWKLTFATRELFGKDVEELANRLGSEGWIVHSANNDIETADIPEITADAGLEGKTPSQRLRNSLYVLWEQRDKPGGDFDTYYLSQMNRLIESIKSKLEPS